MRTGRRAPRSVRVTAVLAGALLAAQLALAAGPAPSAEAAKCRGAGKPAHTMGLKRAERLTHCLINRQRRVRGLARLKPHRRSYLAARSHNRAMVRTGCFAHVCPGELDLVERLRASRYLPCSCSWGAAENIAWATGHLASPRRIVRGWMRSRGHRRNILDPAYEHLGVAVKRGVPTGHPAAGATFTTDFGYKR